MLSFNCCRPTAGSRSREAGPPQSHRERTEDPRRARPKGGPKDQKGAKEPREGKAEKTDRGDRAAGKAERRAKDKKGPKGPKKGARPRADRKDLRAATEGRGGGGSALLPMNVGDAVLLDIVLVTKRVQSKQNRTHTRNKTPQQ